MEQIGKSYLWRGVKFALNKDYGKSYEFFKLGLDILTCDCTYDRNWLRLYQESKDNFFQEELNDFEFYFVKAYILSQESDKTLLKLALTSIDKFLTFHKDAKYGNYVKGKILIQLGENEKAYKSFQLSGSRHSCARTTYNLGKLKPKVNEGKGLKELYYSFVRNPINLCVISALQKEAKINGEVEFDEGEFSESGYILLYSFKFDESKEFQKKFQEVLLHHGNYEDDDEYVTKNALRSMSSFIEGIERNYEVFTGKDFAKELENEESFIHNDIDSSYSNENKYYNDALDMDQQSSEFWDNI